MSGDESADLRQDDRGGSLGNYPVEVTGDPNPRYLSDYAIYRLSRWISGELLRHFDITEPE